MSSPTAVTYNIDPVHSHVGFSVRHLGISHVRGEFTKVSGTLTYEPDQPESSVVEVVIETASFSSGQDQRDAHIRTAEFLDADTYPTITFKSTKVERTGADGGTVTGDLTLHGVTKEVVLTVEGPTPEVTDPYGGKRIGVEATTKINRKDYGIVWNATLETGHLLIGDVVTLTLDVQFVKS